MPVESALPANETSTPAAAPARGTASPVMRINSYDRASSFMIAAVIALFCCVIAALGYWWSTRRPAPPELVIMEVIDVVGGGDLDGAPDETLAVESPEPIEAEQLEVQEQLDVVTDVSDAAALQTATLFEPEIEETGEQGSLEGTGRRPLGFGPGSGGGVAREMRWYVSFSNEASLTSYAQQLDYFGIELGAVFKDGRLVYLSNMSKTPRTRTVNTGKGEERLYFTWQGGDRKQADIQLFQKAGVDAGGANILHFYPEKIENHLATIEVLYANRTAKEVRRTYFSVVPQKGNFIFQVTRQTYLR